MVFIPKCLFKDVRDDISANYSHLASHCKIMLFTDGTLAPPPAPIFFGVRSYRKTFRFIVVLPGLHGWVREDRQRPLRSAAKTEKNPRLESPKIRHPRVIQKKKTRTYIISRNFGWIFYNTCVLLCRGIMAPILLIISKASLLGYWDGVYTTGFSKLKRQ